MKGSHVNQLPLPRQAQIIALLTEGMSIRSTARLLDMSRDTVARWGELIGVACDRLHNTMMQNLQVPFIEIDEQWSFIHTKQHKVREADPDFYGDLYLWVAVDPVSKVAISYLLGKRTGENAKALLRDVRRRVINRPQITTDAFPGYVDAVEESFGIDVHYVSVKKEANFLKTVHQGEPDLSRANTTFVERINLTTRMQLRRHARRTNAHSKTLQHHHAAVALHFGFYHFCRQHQGIRVTPAMEMGLTDHIWSAEELIEQAQACPETPPPAVPEERPRLRLIQGGKVA